MLRASLLLTLSLLSCSGDPRSEGRSGCRFERPRAWTADDVTWLGRCRGGFADGSGVLLNAVKGQQGERFYGQLHQERLNVGVLQTGQGYVAGTWAGGVVAEKFADDMAQRNAIIVAFQAAADASTSVSKSFAKKGDVKASWFYAKQARSLRDQMD
jgi:hypothetical protein